MEHTLSLNDSGSAPPPAAEYEPSSYDESPYEAPVPLHPHVEEVEAGWVQETQPQEPGTPPSFGSSSARRVVLRMSGGESVELVRMSSEDEAITVARDFVRRIAEAEAAGVWPEFEGRFLRPDTIVSVDVEVAY
jgi:hypothetical protein